MNEQPAPKIRVFFSGLLIMHIDDKKGLCEVAIPNTEDHFLSIVVSQRKGGFPEKILLKHEGALADDVWIDVIDTDKLLTPYKAKGKLKRKDPPPEHEQDIRWAIDLEGENFHNQKIEMDYSKISRRIYLNKGFFYTAVRTDPQKIKKCIRSGGNKPELELYSVASIIGADISLVGPKARAVLQYANASGLFQEFGKEGKDITYEIFIQNNPTQRPEEDFKKLYQVITGISPSQKFNMYFKPDVVDHDVPCMTAFLGVDN